MNSKKFPSTEELAASWIAIDDQPIDHSKATQVDFSEFLRTYNDALDRILSWGVKIHPRSRLLTYKSKLIGFSESTTRQASLLECNNLSCCLYEMDAVVDSISCIVDPPSTGELAIISQMASGCVYADDDRGPSIRDKQYELWLQSLFRKHNMATAIEEPDIQLLINARRIPVAAKRPMAVKSLRRNIVSAIRQLDNSPGGGVVAVCIDRLLRPTHMFAHSDEPADAARIIDVLFLRFLESLLSEDGLANLNPHNAIAFIFTGALPAFSLQRGIFSCERRVFIAFNDNDVRLVDVQAMLAPLNSYCR